MRKLFGTDGVRGTANIHPMTADMALRIGAAVGRYFRRDGTGVHRVVIGKDTRISGYMFESALEAGLVAAGADVRLDILQREIEERAILAGWTTTWPPSTCPATSRGCRYCRRTSPSPRACASCAWT